eukprot:COSAG02_NODE_50_length_44860_cov_203.992739_10_plen_130_part_00
MRIPYMCVGEAMHLLHVGIGWACARASGGPRAPPFALLLRSRIASSSDIGSKGGGRTCLGGGSVRRTSEWIAAGVAQGWLVGAVVAGVWLCSARLRTARRWTLAEHRTSRADALQCEQVFSIVRGAGKS